jgi:uncharacterized protein with GYD domain
MIDWALLKLALEFFPAIPMFPRHHMHSVEYAPGPWGQYDAVLISEFPSDEACAKFTLSAGALGNISTETLKAFSEAEFRKIVGSLS